MYILVFSGSALNVGAGSTSDSCSVHAKFIHYGRLGLTIIYAADDVVFRNQMGSPMVAILQERAAASCCSRVTPFGDSSREYQ